MNNIQHRLFETAATYTQRFDAYFYPDMDKNPLTITQELKVRAIFTLLGGILGGVLAREIYKTTKIRTKATVFTALIAGGTGALLGSLILELRHSFMAVYADTMHQSELKKKYDVFMNNPGNILFIGFMGTGIFLFLGLLLKPSHPKIATRFLFPFAILIQSYGFLKATELPR